MTLTGTISGYGLDKPMELNGLVSRHGLVCSNNVIKFKIEQSKIITTMLQTTVSGIC